MPRGPARPHPPLSVKTAAQVAQAIRDSNAGRPMNRILLAEAMGRGPSSSELRDLITASGKYGFTKGSYAAETIELEPLGEQLTKPRSQDEHLNALREGMRKVPIFNQLLTHYVNNKLPTLEFLKNTLERAPFNVSPEWSQEIATLFTQNGQDVGFVRNVNGSLYVILEAGRPIDDSNGVGYVNLAESEAVPDAPVVLPSATNPESIPLDFATPSSSSHIASYVPVVSAVDQSATPLSIISKPIQFFIAHGWDREALHQVQNILKRFDIPYVVAQDEPNVGRPISQKVRDLMKACSAGIFIFSADEEFKDKDGKSIWRPRENVIIELGAAALEYGQRIVIFKEKTVYFPTDYRDLGYIEYEKDNIQAKATELLMELIALKAIRITAGG